MNISPVFSIIKGNAVTAIPAPAGGFWRASIAGHKAAFFAETSTAAFWKARIWIVSQAAQQVAA